MPMTSATSGRSWASSRAAGTSGCGSQAEFRDPPGSHVDPHEARVRRRRGAVNQRPNPGRRRAAESRSKDCRVATYDRSIGCGIDQHPAAGNAKGAVLRQRQGRRLGDLAIRRAGRRADVVEPVPDLEQDQDPVHPIDLADVDRARRVVGPGRQLEPSDAASRLGEPEEELLGEEVTGVPWRRIRDVRLNPTASGRPSAIPIATQVSSGVGAPLPSSR